MSQSVFILGGKRTPMGEYVGAQLSRRGGRCGLATACIGGGQGIAIICERV